MCYIKRFVKKSLLKLSKDGLIGRRKREMDNEKAQPVQAVL